MVPPTTMLKLASSTIFFIEVGIVEAAGFVGGFVGLMAAIGVEVGVSVVLGICVGVEDGVGVGGVLLIVCNVTGCKVTEFIFPTLVMVVILFQSFEN